MSAQPVAKQPQPIADTSTASSTSPKPAGPSPAPARGPSRITDITVEHGPVDLLGRFFLKADTAARQRGVSLSFGTYEELVEANRKNSDSWKRIISMYDPRYCPAGLAPDRAFCILGRDARGEVVATHAARFFDFDDNDTLYDVATSSRMFYDDPERMKLPGERCEISASVARTIRGRVLINGAVWYHPSFRKRELAMIIPRAARAYAYTRWKIDYSMGLVVEAATKGGVVDSLGYPHREWELRLFNSTSGNVRCCFAWMSSAEMLDDLERWLVGFDAQVDSGLGQRHAQHQR
ncbi:MAG TPA: hypothetical protein VFA64_03650 [Hyphomicrobiaceae bacterium]|nr:hypothetical protein [Hyphomicrobiaceae bacterium]